jgi:hypothetical protein
VASRAFRSAPKLSAFLRFVVERTLAGDAAHIKGYTIAIEALGRDESFDPATDPIVRVEAGRLRRALARYYAEDGRDDAIVIELARGSYVPTFRRRTSVPHTLGRFRRLRNLVCLFRCQLQARPFLMAAALLAAGASPYAAVDLIYLGNILHRQSPASYSATRKGPESASRQQGQWSVGPVLHVEPVTIVGTPGPDTISVATLHDRLVDALARFDDVDIVSDRASPAAAGDKTGATPSAGGPDYRLAIVVRYYRDGSAVLIFRLLDVADGTVLWSRSFDGLRPVSEAPAEKARVLRGVAMPLLQQPFGVIHARERIKLAGADPATDSYRCLLDSHEYLRSFDRTQHAAVRACLEQAVARDPAFASGFVQLARVYLREHQFAVDVQPGPPALDRAFAMTERALTLKPNSARAHFVLFDLYLARDNLTAAKPQGERAVALNPYDLPMAFHYGALLVFLGEIDRGEAIVRQAASETEIPAGRLNFILFVAAYLKNDLDTAAYHARQVIGDPPGAGCLARALVAAKQRHRAEVMREMECLRSQQSGWGSDPRAVLKKLFPAPAVLDRVVADLLEMVATSPN